MSVSLEQLNRWLAKQKASLLSSFAPLLFAKTDLDFIAGFDLDGLVALAQQGLKFIEKRSDDDVLLRVYNPSFQIDGWEAPYTLVELCLADRPFIVDSVKGRTQTSGV